MPLTDTALKTAKPQEKLYRLSDSGGLYIEIAPSGGKWWRLKYRHDGKEKRLSLGTYPDTSLKDARDRRDQARRDLAAGIDPGAKRKAEKATRTELAANTFEAVAREWHQAVHCAAVTEGHAARTLLRLEQDAFPWIGAAPIAEVTAPKLLDALRKVEARGGIETAHRVRQACGQVFRYGIATGRCERDPAADLRDALQPVIVKHHAAITDPRKVGELLRAFDDYQGLPTTRAALKLAPLVFLRPGELRQAEWSEFDLDAAVWTVPAARMKRTKQQKVSGAPHLVPLSRQAVAVLRELEPLTGRGRYVFPSPRGGSRPMSDNAVLSALRRMGFAKDEMSGHGFRAMARTIMVEKLNMHPDVIEAQLAHGKSGPLGAAYDRAEFMEQRRNMMTAWADYLDRLRVGAEVMPLRA